MTMIISNQLAATITMQHRQQEMGTNSIMCWHWLSTAAAASGHATVSAASGDSDWINQQWWQQQWQWCNSAGSCWIVLPTFSGEVNYRPSRNFSLSMTDWYYLNILGSCNKYIWKIQKFSRQQIAKKGSVLGHSFLIERFLECRSISTCFRVSDWFCQGLDFALQQLNPKILLFPK